MARSKTAADAILYYEAGQSYTPMAALTDSGDHTIFTSGDECWSGYEGKEPVVRPDGLLTGGVISAAASGSNDVVDVSAATAYVAGVQVSVPAATDLAITRASVSDYIINSIVIQDDGGGGYEFAAVQGTEGSAFSETRAAAGGPALIAVGSIEIGQVRTDSQTAAAIAAAEIFQVPGTHLERSDYPVWDEDWASGEITFAAVLPLIHTASVPRRVYAAYYTPIYSEVPNAADCQMPENSHSVTSTQVYGGTVGSRNSTLGQGSFTALLQNGVTDTFVKSKDKNLWFKFLPDRYRSEYILAQGVLGIARQFPAGDSIKATCTISADAACIDKES